MEKDYLVTKSNILINSRYDLSVEEQRIILTLASMVQPDDVEFKEYSMSIDHFNKLLGIEGENKYTRLRKITKDLMGKTFEIETKESYIQLNWLTSCEYVKGKGIIKLEFSHKIKPYFLALKNKFTSYHLINILKMKSKYSIRMYEILKSNEFKKNITIDIDDLKKVLKCENYNKWGHLKDRVLEQSIKEINAYTDLFVTYEPEKEGRKIKMLKFNIDKAENDGELYNVN